MEPYQLIIVILMAMGIIVTIVIHFDKKRREDKKAEEKADQDEVDALRSEVESAVAQKADKAEVDDVKVEVAHLAELVKDQATLRESTAPLKIPDEFKELEERLAPIIRGNDMLDSDDLLRIGNTKYGMGETEEAMAYYELALDRATANRDERHVAYALGNIGMILNARGFYDAAITNFLRVLAYSSGNGDTRTEAVSLGNVASAYWQKGDTDEALRHAHLALDKYKKAGDDQGVVEQLGNISNFLWDQGKSEEAMVQNDSALRRAVEKGYHWTVATSYLTKGLMQSGNDDNDSAIDSFKKSVRISRLYKHSECEAAALSNLGLALLVKDQAEEALQLMEASLSINRRFGFLMGVASDMKNIGNLYASRGDFDGAIEWLDDAVKVFEQMDMPAEVTKLKDYILVLRLQIERRNEEGNSTP